MNAQAKETQRDLEEYTKGGGLSSESDAGKPLATEETGADRPAAPISKPKRMNKKTRLALEAEFRRGYDAAMERDRGMEMLGTVGVLLFGLVTGLAVGVLAF